MTTNATTKVLCVRRVDWERVADEYLSGQREGFIVIGEIIDVNYAPDDGYDALLRDVVWIDREFAEKDASHKQIIPYTLIDRGTEILHYSRSKIGSESRLHGLRSVGIGGHVEIEDVAEAGDFPSDWIDNAILRELGEEIPDMTLCSRTTTIMGFVNSESTFVNRVHLGIVLWTKVDRCPTTFSPEIADPQWATLEELRKRANGGEFEEWSRLVLEGMER